jgi:hypothetical protein
MLKHRFSAPEIDSVFYEIALALVFIPCDHAINVYTKRLYCKAFF